MSKDFAPELVGRGPTESSSENLTDNGSPAGGSSGAETIKPRMPKAGRRMRVLGGSTVHTLAIDNLKPSEFFNGYCEQGYGKAVCGTKASRWVADGDGEACAKCQP